MQLFQPSSSGKQLNQQSSNVQLNQPSTSRVYLATNNDDESNEITVNIPRAIASTTNCIICNKIKHLIEVPDKAYVDTYIFNNILIPNKSKCCKSHINRDKTFYKWY